MQPIVALSQLEAKHVAPTTITKGLWLQTLLFETGHVGQESCDLYSTDQSYMALSKNPQFHHKFNHIKT